MNKIWNLRRIQSAMLATLCGFMSTALIACNDDNGGNGDEPDSGEAIVINPSTVFPKGVPGQIGDIKNITKNADGLITSMSDDRDLIKFEYANVNTRGDKTPAVIISIYFDDETIPYQTLKCTLNNRGFVDYCEEYDNEEQEISYWWFKYNADDQMDYMKRSEGGNEETFITFKDGDIIQTKQTSEDPEDGSYVYNISYTSSITPTPIDNLGGIMFFDNCFNIDLDEMIYAYYAGLLGKATKHLPLVLTYDDGYTENFTWILNSAGLPTIWYADEWNKTEIRW